MGLAWCQQRSNFNHRFPFTFNIPTAHPRAIKCAVCGQPVGMQGDSPSYVAKGEWGKRNVHLACLVKE